MSELDAMSLSNRIRRGLEEKIDALRAENELLTKRAETAEANQTKAVEALGDLLTWFPQKPSDPEWRLKGGEHGADEAVAFARAALKQITRGDAS